MPTIRTIQSNTECIDVNDVFRNYKYAIPEHAPILLSNGNWLHTYRLTRYNDVCPGGDPDIEQDAYERELYD